MKVKIRRQWNDWRIAEVDFTKLSEEFYKNVNAITDEVMRVLSEEISKI